MISNNQVALCNELNMNFDEASELFCEESLQSMQMAKISGGDSWMQWVFNVFTKNPYIGTAVVLISIVSGGISIYQSLKGTEAPTGLTIINGVLYYNGDLVDSIKIDNKKGYHQIWTRPSSNGGATSAPTN